MSPPWTLHRTPNDANNGKYLESQTTMLRKLPNQVGCSARPNQVSLELPTLPKHLRLAGFLARQVLSRMEDYSGHRQAEIYNSKPAAPHPEDSLAHLLPVLNHSSKVEDYLGVNLVNSKEEVYSAQLTCNKRQPNKVVVFSVR